MPLIIFAELADVGFLKIKQSWL